MLWLAGIAGLTAAQNLPMVANCYRRMDIDLAQCNHGDGWTMHLYDRKAMKWTVKDSLNCFGGHGAKTVPGPEPFPDGKATTKITLAACQAGCTRDAACTGIVTSTFAPQPHPPTPGGIPYNPGEQIAGPNISSTSVEEWLKTLVEWRTAVKDPKWYKGAAFEDPQLKWTQTSYIQPQMHPYDRFFFDPTIGPDGSYTVKKYLDDLKQRYGGVDSILMWPTYTQIGMDDRSQFDLFEAMPGGVAGVRQVVKELHNAGVKVLIPYNPWDAGTLRCRPGGATCGGNKNLTVETAKNSSYCDGPATAANPGVCDARIMDSLIQEMGADGFNGDTMGKVPEEFYDVSVGLGHSVAIEPEGGGNVVDGPGNWDTMGWGYWKVDSWKWFDARRMTNICERWAKNHTDALQYALFNGDGFESWENVWGTWMGITEADGEQIRRVGTLLRFLGGRGYLQSQKWVPHVTTAAPNALFASVWPSESADGSVAWTIVNRSPDPLSGPAIKDATKGMPAGTRYYDLYNGIEIKPDADGTLPLSIERFGAVLATTKGATSDAELVALMKQMAEYAKVPIASLDPTWTWLTGARVPIARAETPTSTEGMAKIPGGPLRFDVRGIEIEGGGNVGDPRDQAVNPFGVGFQYEWESQPNRYHLQWLDVPEFYLDITPVTQLAFSRYLANGKSALSDDRYHYLKNWNWSNPNMPTPFAGNETLPVTYVGIEEARAYCKAMGKRLPHEEEWVFAASGGGDSTRAYPWGNTDPVPGSTTPEQVTGTVFPGPDHVGKYKAGASPFGIMDMVGSVWQMTDEYQDLHDRSVVVKGGANYRPSESIWYFPQTAGNCATGHCGMTSIWWHNKYYLMNSRYERAGTLGFRCAADIPGSDKLNCKGKAVCGKLHAPAAKVDLAKADAQEWAVFGAHTTRSPGSKSRIGNPSSGLPGAQLSVCNGTQSTFAWSSGNSSMGACLANGSHGVVFDVKAYNDGKPSTMAVYAGATGAATMVTATLVDGTETTVFTEHINTTWTEIAQHVTHNIKWELGFTAKSASAVLTVNVSASKLKVPLPTPAPSPAPTPCPSAMCGTVVKHIGDVVLSALGKSDWAHYGLGSLTAVNRKCNVSPLIRPIKIIDGSNFFDCPQTFTWEHGGYEQGTPHDAQVGSVVATPSAIFVDAGGSIDFAVDIPPVMVTTSVYVYIGACNNKGTLTTSLVGKDGAIEGTYNYTMSDGDKKNCQWSAVATLSIPSSSSAAARTLTGTWTQASDDTSARNIQFHAIAVDAGEPIAVAGPIVTCASGGLDRSGGNVVLQAAVLS